MTANLPSILPLDHRLVSTLIGTVVPSSRLQLSDEIIGTLVLLKPRINRLVLSDNLLTRTSF